VAAVTVSFANTIKPYFTACYRSHMMNFGDQFDLWDAGQVQAEATQILARCQLDPSNPQSMPAKGCPEGVWNDQTRKQFVQDFQAWMAQGYPP
jgi:hypothetical protein